MKPGEAGVVARGAAAERVSRAPAGSHVERLEIDDCG